jgi:methylated-DNA-[protein]-cysteine S-methyltransferase
VRGRRKEKGANGTNAALPWAAGRLFLGGHALHALSAAGPPLHLTFSLASHEKACQRLAREGAQIAPMAAAQGQVLARLLTEILTGRRPPGPLPDSPWVRRGTPLQKRVWALLLMIPYGETRTYGQLARALGNAGLARAVGQACAANPLAVLVPCHRVVGSHGPGGFNGGLAVKEFLLAREKLPA